MFGEGEPMCEQAVLKKASEPGIITRLRTRKKELENELKELSEALAIIDKNPAVADTLEVVTRIAGRRF